MEMSPQTTFTMTFTVAELRLVCQALGGRLREEDVQPAHALDRAIASARITHAEQYWREMTKLKNNLETEEPTHDPSRTLQRPV